MGDFSAEDELRRLHAHVAALEQLLEVHELAVLDQSAELERADAELRSRADELARSNAELEQFAYVASHDLQEPLRMVSSYLDLLAERYQGSVDEKGRRWIQFALDGAARMKRMIQDLLEYSRVGTHSAPPSQVDTAAACDAAVDNLRKAIEESDADVTRGPLPAVLGDAAQLERLFQNLIGNAIKFRGPQRPVVRVEALMKDGQWTFSVRDNGIGIDPQFFDRVFVIFQRLHTASEYPGTGIGLAVCKKIVERHGGRIWVESQPGQGAAFFFTIPERAAN